MTSQLPTLPVGPLDLLVKAALAPDDIAQEAWLRWRNAYSLDETPWNEVRLLGAVTGRIDWLEPAAEIAPRMKGIQKFLYAQTQFCLTGCMSAMKVLSDSGIPMMLIKGAARVVADQRRARERLVRDLDVLVPLDRASDSFAALHAAGWTFRGNGAWQKFWHGLDSTANHHAWSLSNGSAEVDLHHFSNSLNRLIEDDEGLWKRSRTVGWRGFRIHLPSPEDSLLISIVHGLRWSRECNADWIIDACSALDAAEFSWQALLDEARRRQVQAILLSGLNYIRAALQRDVPQQVLDGLSTGLQALQWEELDVYASVPMPRTPEQNQALLAMAMKRSGQVSTAGGRRDRLYKTLTAASLPLRASVRVEPAPAAAETAELTVRLITSQPAATRLIGTLSIVGLVLDCQTGVLQPGTEAGAVHDFHFTIPRQLLTRRGATQLFLSMTPSTMPAYPPWRFGFQASAEWAP